MFKKIILLDSPTGEIIQGDAHVLEVFEGGSEEFFFKHMYCALSMLTAFFQLSLAVLMSVVQTDNSELQEINFPQP
jgi:hypothetical protein